MEKPIPTHAVKAVITDEHDRILFLQRNGKSRADMKSNWDLPGGLVEANESDEVALERELQEELGRKAKIGQVLGEWKFFRPFDSNVVNVTNYAATLDSTVIDTLTLSNEHLAARFVDRAALPQLEVKDSSILDALGE